MSAATQIALEPVATVAQPCEYLSWIDHFRALAILMIVALHAGNALLQRGLHWRTPVLEHVSAANDILFHSATIYFAIISGVLYGRLFRHRPYAGFLRGRLTNIGLPYVVVSTLLTAMLWSFALWQNRHGGSVLDLAWLIGSNIIRGDAWNTMWYIPVVLGFCLLSPLLLALVERPRLRWGAVTLMLLPIVFSRTGTVLTASIFIHFLGAYIFGLAIGRYLDPALDSLKRWLPWLATVALAASGALAWFYAADIDRVGPVSSRESLYYVQRLAIACLLMVALQAKLRRPSPIRHALGPITAMSFGIYFVHGPILRPVAKVIGAFVPAGQPWWTIVLAIAATALVGLALSLLVILGVRRLTGSWSRYLVGA